METQLPSGARVLVTGASGFIGRRLVRVLLDRGCRVWCFARGSSSTQRLEDWGAQVLRGEIGDAQAVGRALAESQAEAVFHAAGVVRESWKGEFEHVNVQGTAAVAQACAHVGGELVLVVVSSLAAAGPSAVGDVRREDDPAEPVSRYGWSKRRGELAAREHASAVAMTMVRPPIVFGPEDRGVLGLMRPIARYGVHALPGDGRGELSLVHVDDLVEGLLRAWRAGERVDVQGGVGSGVYFMSSAGPVAYRELWAMMGRATGRERVRAVRVPGLMLRGAGLAGDVVARLRGRAVYLNSDKVREALAGSWACSSDKARTQLEWEAERGLEARLAETAEWYRNAGWL